MRRFFVFDMFGNFLGTIVLVSFETAFLGFVLGIIIAVYVAIATVLLGFVFNGLQGIKEGNYSKAFLNFGALALCIVGNFAYKSYTHSQAYLHPEIISEADEQQFQDGDSLEVSVRLTKCDLPDGCNWGSWESSDYAQFFVFDIKNTWDHDVNFGNIHTYPDDVTVTPCYLDGSAYWSYIKRHSSVKLYCDVEFNTYAMENVSKVCVDFSYQTYRPKDPSEMDESIHREICQKIDHPKEYVTQQAQQKADEIALTASVVSAQDQVRIFKQGSPISLTYRIGTCSEIYVCGDTYLNDPDWLIITIHNNWAGFLNFVGGLFFRNYDKFSVMFGGDKIACPAVDLGSIPPYEQHDIYCGPPNDALYNLIHGSSLERTACVTFEGYLRENSGPDYPGVREFCIELK